MNPKFEKGSKFLNHTTNVPQILEEPQIKGEP
jgi:hypothetical protein